MKHIITLLVTFIGCCESFAQMNYTNLEWVDRTPIVGNPINHTSSVILAGRLHVTGNTVNVNGDTDILTIKYDTNGDTLWMRSFQGTANGDDYGVEIKSHPSGAIYVVGAIDNVGTGYDYCVLKYSATGNLLWSFIWNGIGNGIDVPSSINIEGVGGAVYVSGSSQASNGFSDYGIIKVSGTGSLDWENYYDFNNLHDGASSISYRPTGIVVTGGSASSIGDWDVATLKLNKTTGAIQQTTRTDIIGATMVEIYGMTTDLSNNLYITGYAEVSGQKNIQTMKLDSNLALVWIAAYDGGFDDVGRDIGVDADGNVYVTGFTELSNGGYNFITVKYNNTGSQLWVRQLGNAGDIETAKAEKLDVTSNGNVYMTGTIEKDGQSVISFVKYDTNGEIKLVREFESDTVNYSAYDINVSGNDVYITGLGHSVARKTVTVLKYEIGERNIIPVVDSNNVETHVADELIIQFHPDAIKQETINNKGVTFGTLSDFVQPEVIDLMQIHYPSIDWDKVRTYKIFTRLTTLDTLSLTRTGFQIPIPEFWATLSVSVPDQDEFIIIDSLQNNLYPHVRVAEVNYLFSVDSDDPYYTTNQLSLYPSSSYPNGDINMEQAWLTDVGLPNIKVGIYDTGLRFSHDDLGGYAGGWDYEINAHISDSPNNGDENGHGTKVAGVIGATRENTVGVAGIAGGNWPYLPSEEVLQQDLLLGETIGVSLLGFKSVGVGLSASQMYEAILEGSLNTTNGYGYGVHVINCSWRRNVQYTSEVDSIQTIWGNVHREVFKNGTVLVASRGNLNTTQAYFPAHAVKEFWVINVGASDTVGNKLSSSSYGDKMDVLAPGDSSMIYSTAFNSDNSYGNFGQTSASAAHVSGLSALMLSHINDQTATVNNLTPDDVEFLIQRYAFDKTFANTSISGYTVGYDNLSGWGFVNAGEVMHYIDRSYFVIKHVYFNEVFVLDGSNPDVGVNTTSPLTASNFKYDDGIHGYGNYTGTQYDVSVKGYHTLNPGDSIHNFWPLNTYTNMYTDEWGGVSIPSISFENHIEMMPAQMTNTSGMVSGRVIHFTEAPDGTPIDLWYPVAPGGILKAGYTLHIESDYASIDEEIEGFTFSCYPNPTTGNLTVLFNLETESNVIVEIFDCQGRFVLNLDQVQYAAGRQVINLNTSNFSIGLYVIKLTINNEFHYTKFIKE